jgi:hypothetical protein
LVVRTESGEPLPADTRINVRYGGNQEGEPYALGQPATPQAVFCNEVMSAGGASGATATDASAGAGGAPAEAPTSDGVLALRCRLYTQGPARLDVTATGYEPIDDRALSLERKKRCEVDLPITLEALKPDAGT